MSVPSKKCGTCSKDWAVSNLILISSRLIVQWSKDLDQDDRKICESVSAVAWLLNCRNCYGKYRLQEIQNVQELGLTTIIIVGTSAFDKFCDDYSDICAALGIGESVDIHGKKSVLLSDTSGTFIQGKYEYFNTLQFFTTKGTAPPLEEQKGTEVEEKTSPDTITNYKSGRFDAQEIRVLIGFVDDKKFRNQCAIDAFLRKEDFGKYAMDHGQLPRANFASYSRMYASVSLNLYGFAKYIHIHTDGLR